MTDDYRIIIKTPKTYSDMTISSPEEWDVLVTLLRHNVKHPLETELEVSDE